MEVDVRSVAAMRTCFAALPLHLIQALQTTYSGFLPPLLVLELRPLDHSGAKGPWHVAWIGAASQSTAIEVAEKLAECIDLPDYTLVHVRARADLPKATMVMLEPASEDDWEILELNAEFAEEQILNQVGIVQEGLRFPLWLHGHTIITFHVVSVSPTQSVGVLVKECNWPLKNKQPSALLLSPIYFKMSERGKSHKEIESNILGNELLENADAHTESDTFVKKNENMDWTKHKEFLASIDYIQPTIEKGYDASKGFTVHNKNLLLQFWVAKQLSVMSKYVTGQELAPLVIGKEMVLHFQFDPSYQRQGQNNSQLVTDQNAVNRNTGNVNIANDVIFLLSVVDNNESLQGSQISVGYSDRKHLPKFCQLYTLEENILSIENWENEKKSEPEMVEVKLGQPLHFAVTVEKWLNGNSGPALSSLSWMEPAASEALNRLTLLLSPKSDKLFSNLGLPLPGHVLLHGPPASGKTQLALSLARCVRENQHILAHVVFVNCSELVGEQAQAIRSVLSTNMSEALDHAPSIVVLDDLDSVISLPINSEGSELSSSAIVLAEFLADLMDACQERGKKACGITLVAFLAVVQSPGALPGCLCSSGRFDFHVQLPVPAATERTAILKHEISRRGLQCSDSVTSEIATKCDGYDASDLEVLVDRATHAAAARALSAHRLQQMLSTEKHGKPELLAKDLSQALENFLPAAMRGIAKSASLGGRTGWEDVGGLTETCNAIREMLELPIKFSKIFADAPLRLRSGVLLYGPPGCGKTHIVGAAAAACSLRFISVKGPELLNKYIGASEEAVRDIFSKASAAAPCILFFDEFDSIAPRRGHDNTGVTDRVVNQLLTELDGVEALNGVFVFAATSRPDLLDAALLRPGRLDRLLFCDFPSAHERLEILRVLSKKLPLADDVDLDTVAYVTEGFSGADLQALLSDAQLESIHGFLECATSGNPLITNSVLMSVASKARPSVPEPEKQRLSAIYSQFLNSRTSVAAKAREAKGKRATLA